MFFFYFNFILAALSDRDTQSLVRIQKSMEQQVRYNSRFVILVITFIDGLAFEMINNRKNVDERYNKK